ncbi:putative membrane protein [Labrenzia sp. EL_13]|nr:putative membrane protein [Labrenzia sp. EL_13]
MWYEILRFAHVIGACVLLGTGAGIAFFMVMSNRTQDPVLIAHVAGIVVMADTVFTATAAVFQPITGYLLTREAGWPLLEGWVLVSLCLYVIVGLFWLPVVWIQIRLRRLAKRAALAGEELPAEYQRLYRIWFVCGFPAFIAVLAIVWLMLTRPDLSL